MAKKEKNQKLVKNNQKSSSKETINRQQTAKTMKLQKKILYQKYNIKHHKLM